MISKKSLGSDPALKIFCQLFTLTFILVVISFPIFASQKTSQALFTEPFDLAAGGTSLTRASQEGILFANPAQLTLGEPFIRWIGSQVGLFASKNISGGGLSSLQSPENQGEQIESESSVVDKILSESYRVGQSTSLSFLTQNLGIAAFTSAALDLDGNKFEDGGLPALRLSGHFYGGAVASLASSINRWLRLGLSTKYVAVSEPDYLIPLADSERFTAILSDPLAFSKSLSYGQGFGVDAGALFFLQGRTVDWSLALKADDIGGTRLNDDMVLKQVYHAGLGLAIHGSSDVLHLAVDLRDISNTYQQRPFKRIHVGARLLIRQTLGLALGLYHGNPSYGVRLNLWLIKVGLSLYSEELGAYPGERKRELYYAYLGFGY